MAAFIVGQTEASWTQTLDEHQLPLLVCGATATLIGTCLCVHCHYLVAGRYPEHPPSWAIYENAVKHIPNFWNVCSLILYLGLDVSILSLLPDLRNPARALHFFEGCFGMSICIPVCFGHVSPHLWRLIHGNRVAETKGFRGDNIYMDFTVAISEVCVKAAAQISCFIVYIFGLWSALVMSDPDDDITLTYWAISIVAVQFYMLNADPRTARHAYMSSSYLLEAVFFHKRGYTCVVKPGKGEWIYPSRPSVLFRMVLHFVVNGMGFGLIWATVPILLGHSESPLDYIMNLFAVSFLHSLDDIGEPKHFTIKFDAVGGNAPLENGDGLSSDSTRHAVDVNAQSDNHVPLMDLPSPDEELRSSPWTTDDGMAGASRMSVAELENFDLKRRLAVLESSLLELENLDLKRRLAALESKVGS